MISVLLLSYVSYLIAIVAFFIIGKALFYGLKINLNETYRFFLYCLSGLVFSIIGFSLCYAHFLGTLNTLLVLLLFYWLWVYKKNETGGSVGKKVLEFSSKTLLSLFSAATLVFLLNTLLRLSIGNWPYFKATKDEVFYTLVTKLVEHKHIESSSIDWYNFIGPLNLRPYHFVEQWLNLIFSKLTSLSAMESMYFIVMPVFFFVTVLGLMSLFKTQSNQPHFKIYFLSILICFIGLPSIGTDGGLSFWMASPIPGNLKYLPLFWLSFIAIHLLRQNQWNAFFAFVSIFPFFNYGLYPIVLVFFAVYIVGYKFLFKERRSAFVFISYLFFMIGIPLWVSINFNPDFHGQYDQKLSEVIAYYQDGQMWTKLKLIAGMGWFYLKSIVLNNIVLLGLLSVFYVFLKKKSEALKVSRGSLVVLLLFVVASSLGVTAILNFMLDSYQIFYLTFQLVIGSVFIVLMIAMLEFNGQNKLGKGLVILSVVFTIMNIYFKSSDKNFEVFKKYSTTYRTALKTEFDKRFDGKQWFGARFMGSSYYSSIYQIQSTDQYEGFPFVFLTGNVHLFTLNTEVVKGNAPDPLGIYKFAYDRYSNIEYFNWWVKSNGFNSANLDELHLAQAKFVNDFKLDFFVIQSGVELPENLKGYVDKEYVNESNGERICFLKKNSI